jgi:hypothetical protein
MFALPILLALSSYDAAVINDHPALYLPLAAPAGSAVEPDRSGHGHPGAYAPRGARPRKTAMPNGDLATVFDGLTQYVTVPSDRAFSVPRGGALTIEAWIRPDVLQFPRDESTGYVHWAGKGEAGQQEYACRMYSLSNTESPPRPSRISGYVFNLEGGLGSGSYFQDRVAVGEWIHVAVVISTQTRPGTVKIYKDGVLRDTTSLAQFNVTPGHGDAPVRIGTRDLRSFFKGAIGKFALYAYALSPTQLAAHVRQMRR